MILAAFYFGITLSFSAAQKGGVIQFFSLIFDFLYFINFYKALSLMSLAVPFFYENLRQPAVEIVVSLKTNDDEIILTALERADETSIWVFLVNNDYELFSDEVKLAIQLR